MKEISKLINVSPTTVSRVLNGHAQKYRISKRTIEKVLAAVEKYNFQPNQVAQNLRLQRTNTIGLVIPDISNPFFANLARALSNSLRAKNKLILLSDTNDSVRLEDETIELLIQRRVDGILIAPVGIEYEHFQKYLQTPMVFIDRYFQELGIPYVAIDNKTGAREATLYLLGKGHRNIACIQGLEKSISNRERVRGFKEAMTAHRLGASQIIGADFSIENGYQSALRLLRQTIPPTAIFALSNQIAIGVMKAAKELQRHIPNDFSLISFDEQPYFQLTSPPLTTIKHPIESLATTAVQMLFDLMAKNKVAPQLLPHEWVERHSVSQL